MFSSAILSSVITTICLSAIITKGSVPPASYSNRCNLLVQEHIEPHDVTGSTRVETVSAHQPLIGGCDGTKYGCCGFPISGMPRSTAQDSCATQNCTACIEAVTCIEDSSSAVLNATSHILAYIGDVCENIVGPQAKQCVRITRAAVSAIQYVESGMNASAVCTRLGFCNSATAAAIIRST